MDFCLNWLFAADGRWKWKERSAHILKMYPWEVRCLMVMTEQKEVDVGMPFTIANALELMLKRLCLQEGHRCRPFKQLPSAGLLQPHFPRRKKASDG